MEQNTVNKLHMIKLLALRALKARYINKLYKLDEVSENDPYRQTALDETKAQFDAYKNLGYLLDGQEFNKQYKRFKKELNAHVENYKIYFLNDMIESFEELVKDNNSEV